MAMQCKKRQKKAILAHFILQTRKYTSQLHKVEQRARERVKTGILASSVIRPLSKKWKMGILLPPYCYHHSAG
jgi:hypothetical protein|nr:MAG: hypothetical protein [Bacteriophage sp.]DAK78911.1 MAG TPA: hypothetical protein [Caudoviricetes sp.]